MSRGTEQRPAVTRATAVAGVVGSGLLFAVVASLSVIQYEFMLSIGWRPLADPGGAWPSGLALAPRGWAMDATFLTSGVCLAAFAFGLERGLPPGSRIGPVLLFVSGVSMSLLAFETDPIMREGPRSIHGLIHDAAFVVFALTMLVSLMFLWRRMRKDVLWLKHSRYTLATGVVAATCLFLPGVAYYVFVVVLVAWSPSTALRLLLTTSPPERNNEYNSSHLKREG